MNQKQMDKIAIEDTQGLIDKSLLLTVENFYDNVSEEIFKICQEKD